MQTVDFWKASNRGISKSEAKQGWLKSHILLMFTKYVLIYDKQCMSLLLS